MIVQRTRKLIIRTSVHHGVHTYARVVCGADCARPVPGRAHGQHLGPSSRVAMDPAAACHDEIERRSIYTALLRLAISAAAALPVARTRGRLYIWSVQGRLSTIREQADGLQCASAKCTGKLAGS